MSDEAMSPGLDSVLDLVLDEALANARTMLPARVTAYDGTKRRASIQVLIKEAHINEIGERVVETIAEIHGVPVWMFGSQANGHITVPVGVGDQGMAIFASSSIAKWKVRGGIVDPGDDTKHSINDCVFVAGLHDFAHVPAPAPTDAIVTHGPTRLGDASATDDKYRVAIQDTLTKFLEVLGTVADTAGACAALKAALEGVGWPDAFVAELVKAK